MMNTPPLDPLGQMIAKYQSNGHQPNPQTTQSPATSIQSSPPATAIQSPSRAQPPTTPTPKKKSTWTGFADKTLWDWLNLLGVFLIPIVIAAASIWFSAQQNATSLELAKQQHDSDQTIATDQQQAATLKAYFDDMTDLILNHGLRKSKPDDEVAVLARAKTLTALRELNGDRKGALIQFLYEAKLIGGLQDPNNLKSSSFAIVSLTKADLSKVNLSKADLEGVDLEEANLSGGDLSGADLQGSSLGGTNLTRVDLDGADLVLAVLPGADLSGADLNKAVLEEADLRWANLSGANLSRASLFIANLQNAKIKPGQLAEAYILRGATLPDGSTYPSQSYPIPNHKEPSVP